MVEDSVSTSDLVDVDAPSVRTVPSDFFDHEIQTDTQASRVEREDEARQAADEAAEAVEHAAQRARASKESAKSSLAKLHEQLTHSFEALSDGSASSLVLANLVGVVGVSAWLSYKAWGLHEQGRLTWKAVGLGAGIIGAVSAVEVVLGG